MTDGITQEEALFVNEEHDYSTEVESEAKVEDQQVEKPENEEAVDKEDVEKTEPDSPSTVPMAALQDERHKRQQLSEENERLRSQIPKSDEAPDPYTNIDDYDAYKKAEWEKDLNAKQANERNQRIEQSPTDMLQSHEDYDEMEQIFQLMTVTDKTLVEKMFASGNEAKFAYDTAKTYKDSLLSAPEPEIETDNKDAKSVLTMPNLAKATAQGKSTQVLESEGDIDDVFADVGYQPS